MPDPPLVVITHAIDHRGVSLKPHPLLEAAYEYPRDTRFFLAEGRLQLHDRGENERLVGRRQRQILLPVIPDTGKHRLHSIMSTRENVQVGISLLVLVDRREEPALRMHIRPAEMLHNRLTAHPLEFMPEWFRLSKTLAHPLKGPALRDAHGP